MDKARFVQEKPSQTVRADPIFADVEQASAKVDKGSSSKQDQLIFAGVQGQNSQKAHQSISKTDVEQVSAG